jgi:hypothetical protein
MQVILYDHVVAAYSMQSENMVVNMGYLYVTARNGATLFTALQHLPNQLLANQDLDQLSSTIFPALPTPQTTLDARRRRCTVVSHVIKFNVVHQALRNG